MPTPDTTTATTTALCAVCGRDDIQPISRPGAAPDVLPAHNRTADGAAPCLGSQLPVVPADPAADTSTDAVRRHAITEYVKAVTAARTNRDDLADVLSGATFTFAGALEYYDVSGIRYEQAAQLWQATAHHANLLITLADALGLLGGRAHHSSDPMSNIIAEQKREGARIWLRTARSRLVTTYSASGITGDQLADLLFNL